MTKWTVPGQIVGEAGPGLWIRVKHVLLPNGEEMPLPEKPVYFLRWELVTTARLYDALPADVGGSGRPSALPHAFGDCPGLIGRQFSPHVAREMASS
jgi:hypothetical protein